MQCMDHEQDKQEEDKLDFLIIYLCHHEFRYEYIFSLGEMLSNWIKDFHIKEALSHRNDDGAFS